MGQASELVEACMSLMEAAKIDMACLVWNGSDLYLHPERKMAYS